MKKLLSVILCISFSVVSFSDFVYARSLPVTLAPNTLSMYGTVVEKYETESKKITKHQGTITKQ